MERSGVLRRGRKAIGIALILISILGMYGWETWGKERLFYDDVLVLKENAERGTVITEEMLTVREMDVDEPYISFEDRERVVGMQTAGIIHKGVPLFEEYFEEPDLSPNEKQDRYGLCLSEEWIASRPAALARGDKVLVLCGENVVTEAFVSHVETEGGIELIVSRSQAASLCGIASRGVKLILIYV